MKHRRLLGRASVLVFLAFICPIVAFAQQTIRLRVNATEAPRKIYHAELTLPASAGPMTLFYPKWIPGEHAPTGPVTDLAGLKILAGGRPLEWKRDSVELYGFHINVPRGATFEESVADGSVIAGTPQRVREEIERQVSELGVNYLLTYMFLGAMSLAEALRSLALFSTEVMPKLEHL